VHTYITSSTDACTADWFASASTPGGATTCCQSMLPVHSESNLNRTLSNAFRNLKQDHHSQWLGHNMFRPQFGGYGGAAMSMQPEYRILPPSPTTTALGASGHAPGLPPGLRYPTRQMWDVPLLPLSPQSVRLDFQSRPPLHSHPHPSA
jgi:hypothetical protein